MTIIYILSMLTFTSFVNSIQLEDTYCCTFAKSKEHCYEVCMELTRTSDALYHKRLSSLLTYNCPRDTKNLDEFWNCLAIYNDTADAWYGNECCELAITDSCRTSCLKSKSREELFGTCKPQYEDALHSCVFKHENRQKCCKRPDVGSFCRHRCVKSFKTETGPTLRDISALKSTCDNSLVQCMKNYTDIVRLKSMESGTCCGDASNQQCQESCLQIISTEMKDTTIINRLRQTCGEIVPHEPMWRCFLSTPTALPVNGPFVTKLQCCSKAASNTCKQLCSKLYGNPWPEAVVWNHFEQQCEQNVVEIELQQCLEEVDDPCTLGCQGLSFCTNFNNRPTSLFRNCNVDDDEMARYHFNDWSSGTIHLPTKDIPVKNIHECEPEKWKAVACSLQIKPCSSKSGKSIICKSDCLSLLNKCADTSRFYGSTKIEEVCEQFSPSELQENCISLSDYTKSNDPVEEESGVTQPCHPNPCEEGHLCIVSRRKCDANEKCPHHRCLPGCKMGHGSDFIVNRGAIVKVADRARGEGCFKSCICSTSGELSPCVNLPCTEVPAICNVAGQYKAHGSNFDIECNFCNCYGGNVTCTQQQCPSEAENDLNTGMPCNCEKVYEPVCGSNGRTYPSACVALCLGQTNQSITIGSCLSTNPCEANPCKWRERCVYTPRTCLTDFKNCRQYECLPRYRRCKRLLKSAIPLLESKAYNNRRHRYSEYETILSSSHFFSNTALLSNDSELCDETDEEFEDICRLTRSKHRRLAYSGSCMEKCSVDSAQLVCGQNYVTYKHSCMAETNGVLVDHPGECKERKATKNGDQRELTCPGVQCPPLSRSKCATIRPPGTCCPLCGAMLRILINDNLLKAIRGTTWHGPVSVRDIVWLLRSQLHVLECQLYGYLTNEGDLTVVVVSTKEKPSKIQEEACIREAQRLSNLINNESPTLTTHLILSPLTAASLTPSTTGGSEITSLSYLITLTIIAMHLIIGYCIT